MASKEKAPEQEETKLREIREDGASAPEAEKVQRFVTIGSKLPTGLHLDLHDNNGNLQARHTVQGNARFVGVDDPRPNRSMEQGFALTHMVPKEHAEEWFHRNRDADIVRNGIIFMSEGGRETSAKARDADKQESDFQPIPKSELDKDAVRRDPRLREISGKITHAPRDL